MMKKKHAFVLSLTASLTVAIANSFVEAFSRSYIFTGLLMCVFAIMINLAVKRDLGVETILVPITVFVVGTGFSYYMTTTPKASLKLLSLIGGAVTINASDITVLLLCTAIFGAFTMVLVKNPKKKRKNLGF